MSTENSFVLKVLQDVERQRFLRQFVTDRSTGSQVYNRITELASKILPAPSALVTLVTTDFQYFRGEVGAEEPWKSKGGNPISYSFCQYAVASKKPFVVEDARQNELVKDNPAVAEMNVISYLGIPLTLNNGISLGSFCVLDNFPRKWSDAEVDIMKQLTDLLILEFETQANVNVCQCAPEELKSIQARILHLIDAVDPKQSHTAILARIKTLRAELRLVESPRLQLNPLPSRN
jgi:GAF domain-containing protein